MLARLFSMKYFSRFLSQSPYDFYWSTLCDAFLRIQIYSALPVQSSYKGFCLILSFSSATLPADSFASLSAGSPKARALLGLRTILTILSRPLVFLLLHHQCHLESQLIDVDTSSADTFSFPKALILASGAPGKAAP